MTTTTTEIKLEEFEDVSKDSKRTLTIVVMTFITGLILGALAGGLF